MTPVYVVEKKEALFFCCFISLYFCSPIDYLSLRLNLQTTIPPSFILMVGLSGLFVLLI